MHEFSLACSIVDIAEKEVKKANASKVTSITLRIGACAGVEEEAFKFAWQAAIQNSVLKDAEQLINKVKGKARCMECEHDFIVRNLFDSCPDCGSYLKDIYEGKEFLVESLTVI